ncbi:GNAT family N-acetyltransferase [Amycolatopsis sp. NPDC004368]
MLNYAIPDDGALPLPAEIAALTSAYAGRGRQPRLEFFTGAAPGLEGLLVAQGYSLERRVPLMTCGPSDFVARPAPVGIVLRAPAGDADVRALRSVQNVAFGESAEVSDAELESTRSFGDRAVLAEDPTTGAVVGGGLALEIVDGVAEIAGIAVASTHRRRGIASALTAHLTHLIHSRGGTTAFLTPGDEGIATVYRRLGYRDGGECVHLSVPWG